jgi:hypothetical protein
MTLKIRRELSLITPVRYREDEFVNYGITNQGELYYQDNNKLWCTVDVKISNGAKIPSVVLLNGIKRSLAVIVADTLEISQSEAKTMVEKRYKEYQPLTYKISSPF